MEWVQGLLKEIRPLPTMAAITAGVTGMAIGGSVTGWPLYAALIASVLFTSHVKDAWVDYYVRKEDQRFPWGRWPETGELLSERQMFAAMGGSVAAFGGLLVALREAPVAFFVVAAAGAGLALSYAPVLDRHPVGSAASYPAGVGLAVVAGGLLSAGRLVPATVAYAVPLVVVLAGAKVVEDLIDADHDEELGKRTVPVALGPPAARRLGYALVGMGLAPIALLGTWAAIGVLGAAIVAVGAARRGGEMEVYPLVAGVYAAMIAVLAQVVLV